MTALFTTFEGRLACALIGLFMLGALFGAVGAWLRYNAKRGAQMSFKIALGATVTDKITGYKGMVIGRTEWLYACRRYVVQARELKDGKPVESINCDEDQLDVVDEPAVQHVVKDTGGPTCEPPRPRDAAR